ncbi:MAG: SMC-Scp complex subunit ScpB [Cytophagales bacterium]|nr:SMC-Scp complex subunit ScpB [Armatimonadota bacterium]
MTDNPSVAANAATLAGIIECLLFVAGEPLTAKELAKTTETDEVAVHVAVRLLRDRYAESGLQVVEIARGYQMATRPEFASAVAKLLAPHANRLSRPALETVTIIAYRQPCTQAEVEAIRGVASDGVLKTLTEREMIVEAGRRQTPGRPILYSTTDHFLHYFGLSELSDLPLLDEDEMEAREIAAANDDAAAHTALVAAGVE